MTVWFTARNRRPAPVRHPPGELHWGAAALAREHRREQGQEWVCDCSCCVKVRGELGIRAGQLQATLDAIKRATTRQDAPSRGTHAENAPTP